MKNDKVFTCSDCSVKACVSNSKEYPAFCLTKGMTQEKINETSRIYREDELVSGITQTAAEVEGQFYGKLTRIEETVEFIKRMGIKKVGIASCISLLEESKIFARILEKNNIENYTASCKIGAVDKREVNIPENNRLRPDKPHESMCNPIMQARYFNEIKTELNIIIGLCVGHDTLFMMNSNAPMTTLIVKDRVTCHNPIAPLHYTRGIYKRLLD